jgi:hypothetical protein
MAYCKLERLQKTINPVRIVSWPRFELGNLQTEVRSITTQASLPDVSKWNGKNILKFSLNVHLFITEKGHSIYGAFFLKSYILSLKFSHIFNFLDFLHYNYHLTEHTS